MKRFSTIMIALIICACSGNQTKNQQTDAPIHCHINGIVHDRPESNKLLLYIGVDGNIAVSSQPYCEIKISDSQFSYDLYLDEPQYCELVFEDEFKNGYWQAIDFIADDGTINMNLYQTEEVGKTDIEGPTSTNEYQSYKVEIRKLQDATNEVRNKLKAEGKTYTEEYSSLITQIEALENNSPKQKQLIEQIQAMTEEQT